MALDPVDVLRHLNALGYDNVEPHLLQQFMKDLKKLIKYEKQKKSRINENKCNFKDCESRGLLKEKRVILSNNCKSARLTENNIDVFERLSRPTSKMTICSKAVSSVGVQTDLRYKQNKDNKYSQILKRTQMDPVSLHQYYQTEWQTHKMPGEKNHDQLRWKIRQMMMRK